MTNRSALFILAALIMLIISACQPQVDLEQAQPATDIATHAAPLATAVPSSTLPIETIIETPLLEAVTPSPKPTLTEELIMPVEPTEQPPETAEENTVDPTSTEQAPQDELQPGVQKWVDEAKADLATRLSIPTGQIELLSFESKVWPNGGLGCPHPDMAYTQVMVEGYLIRLQAGDQIYNYHGGGGSGPFLCEQSLSRAKPDPIDITDELLLPPGFDE